MTGVRHEVSPAAVGRADGEPIAAPEQEGGLRRRLSERYRTRTRPIGFYPLPDTEVGPDEFRSRWTPYETRERRRGLVYVHVPFCRQRCGFCRFYPGPYTDDRSTEFTSLAALEINRWASLRSGDPSAGPVEAVFVGGGTPSALNAEQIRGLLDHLATAFDITPDVEVTVEWYPKDADAEKLAAARDGGLTRLSVGAQSWHPSTLDALAAHHRPDDVDALLEVTSREGVENVNVDLMANVPGQTIEEHLDDVDRAIAAGATMVSVNLLEVATGSPLAARGAVAARDEVKRSWLAMASEKLAAASYRHQRVRNFFRDGMLHRYNGASAGIAFDIVPIGPGAYGFVGGWPVINAVSFSEWRDRLRAGVDGVAGCSEPTDDEMRRAFVVNSLLELSIDAGGYRRQFRSELAGDFPVVEELVGEGAFGLDGEVLRLNDVSSQFGDDIAAEVFSGFQQEAFDAHLSIGRQPNRSQYFPVVKHG